MSITPGYLVCITALSFIMSYLLAGLFCGRGYLPGRLSNWTVGTIIMFVFLQFIFLFMIYLEISGQTLTLIDAVG